ncbi:right-handed parallel beta-helix repeat-containing protein [Ancylobacter radicis]|uniref:Right-handed parallel beta-helix repeat-containing protein n=1 Tax=Ancylobacter radicis TaxID=2836179 RepID=A0ABS5R3L3_9HYPH|nr:right-handed parallel beta-helix repeat-containing protein [Ancylobacter radicis]MBS9476248.1 right-handed parallel beta-helix repeat-containing protein [Ancylobacter radicis]
MTIPDIADGDSGAVVRAKINAAFAKANLVDSKADLLIYAEESPGDALSFFTESMLSSTSVLAGEAASKAIASSGSLVTNLEGKSYRLIGSGIVTQRATRRLRNQAVYAARWGASRDAMPADPVGDTVRYGIAWLAADKSLISTTTVDEYNILPATGVRVVTATVSRDMDADYTAPSNARYWRPYVQTFGGAGTTTDIEFIDVWKSSGLPGPKGDTGDVTVELEALRDEAVQAYVDAGEARDEAEAARDLAVAASETHAIYVSLMPGADPTGVTDNHTVLEDAIAAAEALPVGKRLLIVDGIYKNSDRLTVSASDLEIRGKPGAAIVAATSTYAPDHVFASSGGADRLQLINLTLTGNGSDPVGDHGTAPQAVYLAGCDDVVIKGCTLHNFMGTGIALVNCLRPRVRNNRLHDIGQLVDGATPRNAVPAIWAGLGSRYVKIQNNYFHDCRWSAVFLFSDESIVSGNTCTFIGESAFYSEGVDPTGNGGVEVRHNQFTNNTVNGTYIVDMSACGFEILTHDTAVSDNTVVNAGTHGIAVGIANKILVADNIVRACNVEDVSNGSAIIATLSSSVYNATSGSIGDQITITGNVAYDERGLCRYGIYLNSNDLPSRVFSRLNVSDNSFAGIATADIYADAGAAPNADGRDVIKNNSAWLDQSLDGYLAATTSATSETAIKSYSVPASSMRERGGIRVTAGGSITGSAGNKYARLQFGGFAGFMTVAATSGQAGNWHIEALIINRGYNSQIVSGRAFFGNAVVDNQRATKTINTSSAALVQVTGQVANAADAVTCDYLIVERIN